MDYQNYAKWSAAALGLRKAELVFKRANVLNVFSGELIKQDIAVENGVIVGLGSYEGETEIDLNGKYIVPGFIDAHLHLESTMVAPPELIQNAVQKGTTTFIVDPHEAVNVSGEDGLSYILDQTENAAANVYVMLPSCVPATPYEDNGCNFDATRMQPYAKHPRVLGLGEVMDYVSVINAAPDMLNKLSLFENKVKDGHAPGLSEKEIAAYALADIATDHECIAFDYALLQLRNGMQVHVREGSGARNLEAIISGVVAQKIDTSGFSFCTDDKHIDDIQREGHISHNIRKSISLGLPAAKAYQMATINAARCYGLKTLGAIAPGRQADIVVLDDFEGVKIHSVYHKGTRVDNKTQHLAPPCPNALKQTMHAAPLKKENLAVAAFNTPQPVMEVIPGQIVTKRADAVLPHANGVFVPNSEFNKAAVIERHKNTGKVGVAPIKGFNLKGGAIASSVSHDSHNIIVVGDSDESILLAVEELIKAQGGYTVVREGQPPQTLPLPIMGLMSDAGFDVMEKTLAQMTSIAHEMGVPSGMEPFTVLSFIALGVIPEIRVMTRGIFDVGTQKFLS
ncbi:adenine deaminase [Eubacteriales bacterium OttesenSCG-928-K08]|nr:adenine deaminase [Eubacteriales bacterium OttesenSCG-928-K08]